MRWLAVLLCVASATAAGARVRRGDAGSVQAAIDACRGRGCTVRVPAGIYTVERTLELATRVDLRCAEGAVLRQADGRNLAHLISLETRNASAAVIANCTIDGNAGHNPAGTSLILVGGSGVGNVVRHNLLLNAPGHGVLITGQSQANQVIDNTIRGAANTGIAVLYSTPTVGRNAITGNAVENYGGFGIGLNHADGNTIQANRIRGMARNGRARVQDGNVEWLEGQDFAGLFPGMHIKLFRGNREITDVGSAGRLRVQGDVPNGDSDFSAGSLEPINLGASSNNEVADNECCCSTDGGIVIYAASPGAGSRGNRVLRNRISGNAGLGISLEASAGPVESTLVSGNVISDNNAFLGAQAAQSDAGIRLAGPGSRDNRVVENVVVDTRVPAPTAYAVAVDNAGGDNLVRDNTAQGMGAGVTRGVKGGD